MSIEMCDMRKDVSSVTQQDAGVIEQCTEWFVKPFKRPVHQLLLALKKKTCRNLSVCHGRYVHIKLYMCVL